MNLRPVITGRVLIGPACAPSPLPAEEESVGWGPVLASLQVPELTMEDFLSESQSGGCFLTLYAFVLQRLNAEHTAANDRRTLALLNSWTHQVDPRWVLVSRPPPVLLESGSPPSRQGAPSEL